MILKKKLTRNEVPRQAVVYPVGTFAQTEKGFFYILSETKRLYIISERLLKSWSPPRVVKTSESALANYRVSAKMRFRPGSLVHNLADGKIFLIENSFRRHVVSPDALKAIGAVYDDAVTVSQEEINLHSEGNKL